MIASGDVNVGSADESDLIAVAGNVVGAGKVSIGASVIINDNDTTVRSYIDNSIVKAGIVDGTTPAPNGGISSDVNVTALLESSLTPIAAGGQGAGKIAIGGSVVVTLMDNTTEAYISGGSTVTALGSVAVHAVDDIDMVKFAGAFNGAGKVTDSNVSL